MEWEGPSHLFADLCGSMWQGRCRSWSLIQCEDPLAAPSLRSCWCSLQRPCSGSIPDRLLQYTDRLLRHQDQLCQESHTRSLNRCSLLDDLETTFDHFGSGRAVVHSMALFFVEISGCMEPGIKERAQVLAIPAQVLRQGSPFAQCPAAVIVQPAITVSDRSRLQPSLAGRRSAALIHR